jgi:competence protein ComEA
VKGICAIIIGGFLFSLPLISTPPLAAASHPSQNEERININAASAEELQRIPGIGPALASRIVEHRRRHGPFKRPQDIVIVRGMSAKFYRRIAHLIRV